MNNYTFVDLKPRILEALNKKEHNAGEKLTLFDGFCPMPVDLYYRWTPSLDRFDSHVKHTSIPMVVVVGESGRLYFFALKALLPELKDRE